MLRTFLIVSLNFRQKLNKMENSFKHRKSFVVIFEQNKIYFRQED